ncbi:MAG: glutamate synthase large subunit [Allosphingosinicella sp.]|uniref:glutamate synthase large subunit n=1 Tax=Allosphingosinicella sp. TaxID=2823234 RepID=UPI00392AF7D6
MPRGAVKQGLYDPAYEHDSCGMGFIAHVKGARSSDIIAKGLTILANLDHRGGVGADPTMGDGAGILIQIPDALLRAWAEAQRLSLPQPGDYAVAMCFLPQGDEARAYAAQHFERLIAKEGQLLLGWREVPVDPSGLAEAARAAMPVIAQAIVARGPNVRDQDAFERKLLTIRKQTQNPLVELEEKTGLEGLADFYMPSFSTRTVVYKGMLLTSQLGSFYRDLTDPLTASALALVHQRFSTNTFPSWRLAHPFRFIAHNGEINTIRGNVNWMNARRRTLESPLLGADLDKMWPIIPHGQSDTASLDNALELLVAGGYPLAHAMMLLIPEAWAGKADMHPARRAFYEYHAALMEPWDGPAAIAFTDGRQIGATLDRNGLRPARYCVTHDDLVILASESGVLPVPEEKIVRKWRLQPGKMLLIDLDEGRIVEDTEVKGRLAEAEPYADWLRDTQFNAADLPPGNDPIRRPPDDETLRRTQISFGYTEEDLKLFLAPMAAQAEDPVGSMGTDTPLAVLSDKPRLLYDYFKQNFAQVTNPPIDPIRESLVMSLVSMVGPRPNLLGRQAGMHKRLEVSQPILTNEDLEKIRSIHSTLDGAFRTVTLDATWPKGGDAQALAAAVQRLCWEATEAVLADINMLILSDRREGPDRIPIPAALATGAVHHHLIRQGLRMQTGLVLEAGEAREVHHFCVLAGYGAEAINPWLAFDTIDDLCEAGKIAVAPEEAQANYIKALGKGLLKVMSKMGISTFQSYCGAQIFDAVGLSEDFVERYFTGTASRIGGAGLAEIAEETARRHRAAHAPQVEWLDRGGLYAQRVGGEAHAWTFDSIANLQHAVRGSLPEKYRAFAAEMNEQNRRLLTLRDLMQLKPAGPPVPLEQVEPAAEIVKRFATGAMSFGSISREAHTTLAQAMNRIGGKSNTGEGGEESARFATDERSTIKQVASGRFGVTADYLVNADEIQIKIAQGAKPGEGGQLPGHKVDRHIASVRLSTPGVGLISPPPHHDIYSIEDLAQLIHDLRSVNPSARISVKLVAEAGVGTVAAGVAKCLADHVTISGYEGGTGASPLTSLTHAGLPWEIGLAETQQTLALNGLRGRIVVQVDGGLRTGRDVAVAALLGADEFGFATAPLIAAGCIMMRKCHLNTCPVGIATQDPVLRARFTGAPEHVVNYFFYVAEELREIMAELGLRSVAEMVGRTELIDPRPALDHWKAKGVDLSALIHRPETHATRYEAPLWRRVGSRIDRLGKAVMEQRPIRLDLPIANTDRSVGTMLSGKIARAFGQEGLEDNSLHLRLTGTAGQSLGAFLACGVTLELIGDANDYVGKGLSGGRIVVGQPDGVARAATDNIVVGNTCLYGATSGEAFFSGVAGERFAVRNSGATAVVEGVGDHGCEYMTGGTVVVLGETGRNFAAGMSGGVAYVWDRDRAFAGRCNRASVELDAVEDVQMLRALIERHQSWTGSARAAQLLDNWISALPQFVMVMPTEYRRALAALRSEAA